MTMPRCWELSILARSFRAAALLVGAVISVCAQPADDAAARLKAGVEALEKGSLDPALSHLLAAKPKFPLIADYTAFWIAEAHAQNKNFQAVVPALDPVWRTQPASPLAGRAAALGARALMELNQPKAALQMLARVAPDQLPQPQGSLLAGQAKEATGDLVGAASHFQRVYFGYPLSDEETEAKAALARLQQQLGDRFPPAMPQARLERGQKLMDGKQVGRAQDEYERMIPLLGGLERDQARVRAAAADYHARKTEIALRALRSLPVNDPEADAERLHYIALCYRRLEREPEMLATLDEMERRASSSVWRQRALLAAANSLLVKNESASYTRLYRACADSAPDTEDGAHCHWKVVWRAYLERRPSALTELRAHLTLYPGSEKAGAALYYLGRLSEQAGDFAAAKRYWVELETRFPNYYYAMVVRARLKRAEVAQAGASLATENFLAGLHFPERIRKADTATDTVTAQRLERGRMLARAGLDKWAEGEMRFGVRAGERRLPLAMELAETAARRGSHDVSIRHIIGTLPDYLFMSRDAAPIRFWKLAFPFPYRAKIERYAREQNLDPFLVAALIRQESLFDKDVVSYAKAIGLMQVMPGTGRELGRRIGLGVVRPASLKNADTNLKIGTYYLRRQLDAREGNVEETLAGYNAGPTRIPTWRSWADYREPSEFVENIPFAQTRDYVQIITRNADIYRWLYANEPAPREETPSVKPAAKARAKSNTKAKSSAKRRK
ncbi:MAG: transglycosylase SLT domain-containing protein [Bryobacterales bacterium]|nr:transglycosylase SLT domain-containing protein [Bryobacterales bacterium]